MRKVIYQGLLALPLRLGGATVGVLGFIGSVWPDKVKKAVGSDFPVQPVAVALLAIAVVYFLMLWLLKPGEQPKPEGGNTTQTTLGPNSPNFSGNQFHGPVTIGGSQPEQPKQSGYSWKNFDHLTRLMSGRSDAALPDMPLAEVVERLRNQPSPPQDMDQAIRDAVVVRNLSTWGRRPGKSIGKVWMDAWENGKFSHEKSKVRYRHPDNPRSEHVWSDIQFNREEVDRWLPPKPDYELIVI
jgi:hypothetical protein